MKFKTTSKQLKNGYGSKFIWQTGYCALQDLLQGLEPIAYTCGIYGWNYDVYCINDVIITTGYRGMIGQEIPLEIEKKYNQLARELHKKMWEIPHEERQQKLEELRNQFIKELYTK